MCLLSCNLNFIHHYWQQSITHMETNLPLRLAGKAQQLFSGFRTTTIPDGYENTERHTFSEFFVDNTRVRSKSALLNAVANNLTPGKFVYTRQFKRVGQIVVKFKRTQVHFISDVFTTVVVLVL